MRAQMRRRVCRRDIERRHGACREPMRERCIGELATPRFAGEEVIQNEVTLACRFYVASAARYTMLRAAAEVAW